MRVTPDLEVREGGVEDDIYMLCVRAVCACEWWPKNFLRLPSQTSCLGLSYQIALPRSQPKRPQTPPLTKHTEKNMTTTTLWPVTTGGNGKDTENLRKGYEGQLWMG